ncbi:MAG TPA: UbiD family decarboxylase, partial [Alphaproteobacteria bacterium]|nr:UbiD family decarboxylase [Alphaproteobacteria bacterium]
MPYGSLRDFVGRLEKSGELVRVSEPVSPVLEMTEIQTRLLAQQGPAVLFENVVDSKHRFDMPVLVNLFGTTKRVAWGMDREPSQLRDLGETLAALRQPEPPGGWREAMGMFPLIKTAMAMKPKTLRTGSVQELLIKGKDIDLATMPIQTCWPNEPAPLITWPLVVTKGPGNKDEDNFNLGVYRMQVIGRNQTLMRWLSHRGGAQHYQSWSNERPEPLPA